MTLDLHVTLTYDMEGPTDILLQVEAAAIPEQRIESAHIQASHCDHFVRVAALDGIGDRIWLRTSGRLSIDYRARMTVLRDLADVATLPQMPLHQLPEVEKMLRLRNDLNINTEGVDVVYRLLQKVEAMRREMDMLKSRLRLYEDL